VRTYLLAQTQDLEALKVGQVLPSVGTVGLLGKAALGPLVVDLVLRPQPAARGSWGMVKGVRVAWARGRT
jgi:hypothetical protein